MGGGAGGQGWGVGREAKGGGWGGRWQKLVKKCLHSKDKVTRAVHS